MMGFFYWCRPRLIRLDGGQESRHFRREDGAKIPAHFLGEIRDYSFFPDLCPVKLDSLTGRAT